MSREKDNLERTKNAEVKARHAAEFYKTLVDEIMQEEIQAKQLWYDARDVRREAEREYEEAQPMYIRVLKKIWG